jgi:hypothetical protein
VIEHILTDWVCQTCKMVTPGGQPDPYPCCTAPFVIRVRAAEPTPLERQLRDEASLA